MKWTAAILLLLVASCEVEQPVLPKVDPLYGFAADGSKRVAAYCPVPYVLTMMDELNNVDTLFHGTGTYIGGSVDAMGLIELRLLTSPLIASPCTLVYGCLRCESEWVAVLKFNNKEEQK